MQFSVLHIKAKKQTKNEKKKNNNVFLFVFILQLGYLADKSSVEVSLL